MSSLTLDSILLPLAGGALIGLAATMLLWMNGRVAGISGILGGLLTFRPGERAWRAAFLAGLFVGGGLMMIAEPSTFSNTSGRSLGTVALAGLLVGFGTILGGGCTSGHGVCGISRLSPRSLIATVVFIGLGVLTVAIFGGAS